MIGRRDASDEELVEAAQLGELGAFTALYDRYLLTVYRRVRCKIPEEDVDDVTQDIFISIMLSLKGFRHQSRFSTWLYTLINRKVADYYRSRKPHEADAVDLMGDQDESTLVLNPHHAAVNLDDKIELRRALSELPEHYREIILLRFADGLKFEQIAQIRDQSLDATKSLYRRAITALQRQITHA